MLVNNAGVAPLKRVDLLEANEESFDRVLNINLKGPYFLTQLVAKWMIEQKKQFPDRSYRIVNIGSMSSYTSSTARGEYCISKAGVSMMTMLYADRLAEFGIGVFEIRPGIIATDMTATVKEKYDKFITEGLTPIKRWGKLPIIPGCGSTTEIVTQFSLGANLYKVFPAKELGGPAFIKAIDPAIHKLISLVPTGGTNAQNIPDYIEAGVLVLGGSFSAIEKSVFAKIIEQQDYKLLSVELKKIKELIDRNRSEEWPKIDFAKASIEKIGKVTSRSFNIR